MNTCRRCEAANDVTAAACWKCTDELRPRDEKAGCVARAIGCPEWIEVRGCVSKVGIECHCATAAAAVVDSLH